MRLEFGVGSRERSVVAFHSNTFLGTTGIRLNGRRLYWSVQLTSPESAARESDECEVDVLESQPSSLTFRWTFDVGVVEKHHVAVTRTRPGWCPMFRRHHYSVEVDSEVVIERTGY